MNARLIPLCATVGALLVAAPALAEGPAAEQAADAAAAALPPLPGDAMRAQPMPGMPMHGMPMNGMPMANGYPGPMPANGATAAYPPE